VRFSWVRCAGQKGASPRPVPAALRPAVLASTLSTTAALTWPVLPPPCRILSAEIDLDDIIRAKFDLDVAGHYSRPDIFQLSVRGQ